MPYIHVASAHHHQANEKRMVIRAITDATVKALEVPPPDVHVFLWELATENMGYAGDEPSCSKINNITVVFRRGRHAAVKRMLIERLTDAVQSALKVEREDIHIILSEVAPEDIGEGGALIYE